MSPYLTLLLAACITQNVQKALAANGLQNWEHCLSVWHTFARIWRACVNILPNHNQPLWFRAVCRKKLGLGLLKWGADIETPKASREWGLGRVSHSTAD